MLHASVPLPTAARSSTCGPSTAGCAPRRCLAARASSSHSASPSSSSPVAPAAQRRLALDWASVGAGAIVALAALASPALADDTSVASSSLAGREPPETVYFGNGCFWGRQYDYVNTEKSMGRDMPALSAVVGYAGGQVTGPDGRVCYYLSDPKTVYEKLGHAEVVQLQVDGKPSDPRAAQEFRSFADTYFKQFRRTPMGMMRLDPQDAGPGYRNVVGLPGGVSSPFFPILKAANANGMELREGSGNGQGAAKENDELNVVWVVDSTKLPFHQAEKYHQFHNGMGRPFPLEYTFGMKGEAAKMGKIKSTGCPELPF